MARIEHVERDRLTARQQTLYDDIMRTRPRGKLSGARESGRETTTPFYF